MCDGSHVAPDVGAGRRGWSPKVGRSRPRDARGRPEGGPPTNRTDFYDAGETARYSSAAARTGIQRELSERAVHLLYGLSAWDAGARLAPQLLVDVGCGAGASSEVPRACGHFVIGLDISPSMLAAAARSQDAICCDMGEGLPLRPSAHLDGGISISALQWLCSDELEPKLRALLMALHASLRPGARFVAQFYPSAPTDTKRLARCAAACGWGACAHESRASAHAVVFDLPHANRAARLFLCLERGDEREPGQPEARERASAVEPARCARASCASLLRCPCAWPHDASCSLQLHARSSAFCDELARRLGGAASAGTAWETRMQREHAQLAKRLQHALQRLWAEAGLAEPLVRAARERLRRPSAAPCGAPGGGHVSPADGLRRRARLEAWLAGEQRAHARHMHAAWQEASAAGLPALAADAEAEVLAMHALPCFASSDFYLCRAKRKRGAAATDAM